MLTWWPVAEALLVVSFLVAEGFGLFDRLERQVFRAGSVKSEVSRAGLRVVLYTLLVGLGLLLFSADDPVWREQVFGTPGWGVFGIALGGGLILAVSRAVRAESYGTAGGDMLRTSGENLTSRENLPSGEDLPSEEDLSSE